QESSAMAELVVPRSMPITRSDSRLAGTEQPAGVRRPRSIFTRWRRPLTNAPLRGVALLVAMPTSVRLWVRIRSTSDFSREDVSGFTLGEPPVCHRVLLVLIERDATGRASTQGN